MVQIEIFGKINALLSQNLLFYISRKFVYEISLKRTVQYKQFLPSPIFSLQKTFFVEAIVHEWSAIKHGKKFLKMSKNPELSQKISWDWFRLPERQELFAGLPDTKLV